MEVVHISESPVKRSDADEIEVLDTACARCGKSDGQVISLTSCNHFVHYKCCTSPPTSSSSSSSSKRVKVSNISRVACPLCEVEINWSDYARNLDRQAYLTLGYSTVTEEDEALLAALKELSAA